MKHASPSVILIAPDLIARADFTGGQSVCRTAPRSMASSITDAVRAALALGEKGRHVWVLLDDVYTQKLSLTSAQTAGLSQTDIGRALSFEIEPFSGIPVTDAAIAFKANPDGEYDVAEISSTDLTEVKAAVESLGSTLAGVAHPGRLPTTGGSLESWLSERKAALDAGDPPVILPPRPAPSRHRYLITGIALEVAAVVFIGVTMAILAVQRRGLEAQNTALGAAASQLTAYRKQIQSLTADLESLQREQKHRENAVVHRASLGSLLRVIAKTRPADVVIQEIQNENTSTIVLSGLALEADAVDEMSIVLTQSLRDTGWAAHTRRKTGKKALANGGPWEFSVAIVHREDLEEKTPQFSQADTP